MQVNPHYTVEELEALLDSIPELEDCKLKLPQQRKALTTAIHALKELKLHQKWFEEQSKNKQKRSCRCHCCCGA